MERRANITRIRRTGNEFRNGFEMDSKTRSKTGSRFEKAGSRGIEIPEDRLTRQQIAWELVEIFEDLRVDEMNELVAINVPTDAVEFFTSYADYFCNGEPIDARTRKRLPKLMLLGYVLRLLEERLDVEPEPFDA